MTWLRDLALILLAAEAFLVALLPLALCGGLVYGLGQLLRHDRLPSWLGLVRAYLELGQAYVRLFMAILVRPILALHTAAARLRGWVTVIARFSGGDR
ncbi:MAG: hypothetical protein N2508_08825 [Anaerolineae bacterium]|nr:hypothetical protein [Anaerolineae bacterium]